MSCSEHPLVFSEKNIRVPCLCWLTQCPREKKQKLNKNTLAQHHHLLVYTGCVYSETRAELRVVNIHISSSITHVLYHISLPLPSSVSRLWSAHLTWLPARPAAGRPGRAGRERGFHPNHLQAAAQDRNHCVWPVQPPGQQQVLWVHRAGEAQQRYKSMKDTGAVVELRLKWNWVLSVFLPMPQSV